MTDGRDVAAVAARVVELVGDRADVEALVSRDATGITRFANSAIHQNIGQDGLDVRVTVVAGGRRASARSTVAGDDGLVRLVDSALAAAALRPVDPDWPGLAPPAAVHGGDHVDDGTAAAGPDDRAAIVGGFVGAGPGMDAAGYCETSVSELAFANSAGQQARSRATMAVVDGIHRVNGAAGAAHQSSRRVADLDGAAAGAIAAQWARDGQQMVDIDPGEYEVVLTPSCVAQVLMFFAYYGFNAKAVAEGQSFVSVGDRQFDEQVSLVDDASDEGSIGFVIDSEGTPKRRVELVRRGETVGMAHDRRSAAKAGVESTGHGHPASATFGPVPVNLVLGAGDKSEDEMVAAMGRGLLVRDFNYIRILDPKTQVCTGLTRNGTFLVEKGEIVAAVPNLRFTQSFVGALAPGKVLGIGRDLPLVAGQLTAAMRVPALHLASWRFTGGAQG